MMLMNSFCEMVDWRKALSLICIRDQRSLSEILSITSLWHAASRIWICDDPEFSLCWRKLCNSDNHHTTAPQLVFFLWCVTCSYFFVLHPFYKTGLEMALLSIMISTTRHAIILMIFYEHKEEEKQIKNLKIGKKFLRKLRARIFDTMITLESFSSVHFIRGV